MNINWVKKNDKELPRCPRCGELIYIFNTEKVKCYRCGSLIEKDDKLIKLLKERTQNEVD